MMTHTDSARSVDFSKDEKYVYSAGYDYRIVKWRMDNSENLVYLTGHTDIINYVKVDPAGEVLASASNDSTLKLWSISKNALVKTLKGHNHYINSAVFLKTERRWLLQVLIIL